MTGALTLMLVIGSCGDGRDGARLRGAVRTPPLVVGSITMPDVAHGGEDVSMRAPADELYLVYFGYTSCPDVCPTTLSDIRVALDDLPDGLDARVTVAMATVDPERDTDEILTGYLAHFFDNGIALRSTQPNTLATAAQAFGVEWQVEDHTLGEPYDVAHTAITYVVDDTGTVVVEWPFGFATEDMTSDLTTLLTKEST